MIFIYSVSANSADGASTDAASETPQMITCKRCGQEMEDREQSEGCEDFHCPMQR